MRKRQKDTLETYVWEKNPPETPVADTSPVTLRCGELEAPNRHGTREP